MVTLFRAALFHRVEQLTALCCRRAQVRRRLMSTGVLQCATDALTVSDGKLACQSLLMSFPLLRAFVVELEHCTKNVFR